MLEVSISRYQHWEYGTNRPSPAEWSKILERLGVDAARLYTGVPGSDKTNDIPLDPDVVMQLVLAVQRQLDALKILCAPHVSDRRLAQAGIQPPDTKKQVTATTKTR